MGEFIELYTDGAARGNPGPGGYGVVLKYKGHRKEMAEAFKLTTNNRMELLAVIVGLESITNSSIPVKIFSDSKYVIDAIDKKWVYNWQKKGFVKKANPDLWRRFLKIAGKFNLELHWIKGHAGHPENERCDALATQAADKGPHLKDTYFEELQSKGTEGSLDF